MCIRHEWLHVINRDKYMRIKNEKNIAHLRKINN